ncbi:MAG: hypothetical protein ABI669_10445 [Usitatibacter sp.]
MKRMISIVFAGCLAVVMADAAAQDSKKEREELKKLCAAKVGKKDTKESTDVAIRECVDKAVMAKDK